MTKFGSYTTGKGTAAVAEVEADYMVSQGEFVQLYVKSKDFNKADELVATFHLSIGCSMRKLQ